MKISIFEWVVDTKGFYITPLIALSKVEKEKSLWIGWGFWGIKILLSK